MVDKQVARPEVSAHWNAPGHLKNLLVENALSLTRLLFQDAPRKVRNDLNQLLYSGVTKNVRLPTPVPLLMFYWTAFASDSEVISFRPDIYDRDDRLIALLSGDG